MAYLYGFIIAQIHLRVKTYRRIPRKLFVFYIRAKNSYASITIHIGTTYADLPHSHPICFKSVFPGDGRKFPPPHKMKLEVCPERRDHCVQPQRFNCPRRKPAFRGASGASRNTFRCPCAHACGKRRAHGKDSHAHPASAPGNTAAARSNRRSLPGTHAPP